MNRTKPTYKTNIGIESVKIIVCAIICSLTSWLANWLDLSVYICFNVKKSFIRNKSNRKKQRQQKIIKKNKNKNKRKNNYYLADKS